MSYKAMLTDAKGWVKEMEMPGDQPVPMIEVAAVSPAWAPKTFRFRLERTEEEFQELRQGVPQRVVSRILIGLAGYYYEEELEPSPPMPEPETYRRKLEVRRV